MADNDERQRRVGLVYDERTMLKHDTPGKFYPGGNINGCYNMVGDTASTSWRADLAKVDIWYASYGSNMWKPRFLCYIQGGQAEGMKTACVGSMDKSPPKEIMWSTFPHRLEQFNDVLFQENRLKVDSDFPLLDIAALQLVESKGTQAALDGWYGDIVCLGKEGDIPILTMTCTFSDVDKFKSGEIPLRPPSKAYANTLIRGLVEGNRFSDEQEAEAYINNAASKPL